MNDKQQVNQRVLQLAHNVETAELALLHAMDEYLNNTTGIEAKGLMDKVDEAHSLTHNARNLLATTIQQLLRDGWQLTNESGK